MSAIDSEILITEELNQEIILSQGDMKYKITLDDAKLIRTSLINALKQSELGDKDFLIAMIDPLPAWIDSDGRVMIGGWLLQLKNSHLVASYRISTSKERAVGYIALINKTDNTWSVTQVMPEKIRFR